MSISTIVRKLHEEGPLDIVCALVIIWLSGLLLLVIGLGISKGSPVIGGLVMAAATLMSVVGFFGALFIDVWATKILRDRRRGLR